MAADPRLLTHPAIRREAERLAREFDAAWASGPHDFGGCGAGRAADVFRALLSDPSRPETRDALVRMGVAADKRPFGDARWWGEMRDEPGALVRQFLAVVPGEVSHAQPR